MKTCMACGRKSGDDQVVCPHCASRLPVKPDAPPDTVTQIDFLLGQVDEWLASGAISAEQARKLRDDYEDRKDRLTLRHPLSPSHPSAAVPLAPANPPSRPIDSLTPPPYSSVPQSYASEARPSYSYPPPWTGIGGTALSYLMATGVALLFAGLVGMVGYGWHRPGMGVVVAVLLVLNGLFVAALRLSTIADQPVTNNTVTVVSLLMVPLEVVAACRLGHRVSFLTIGLTASLASLAASGITLRYRTCSAVSSVVSVSIAAMYAFGLALLLEHIVHLQGLKLAIDYAPAFIALATIYFLAARWDAADKRVMQVSGHAVVTIAVGIVWWTWLPGASVGPAALTLALGAVAYIVGTTVIGTVGYANAAFIFAIAAANLGVVWHGVKWDGWYWYAMATNVIAIAALGFTWLATSLDKDDLATGITRISRVAAGIAVVPQVIVAVGCAFTLDDIHLTTSHAFGALVCAVTTLCLLRSVARRSLNAIWIGYIGVLCEFLVSCLAPKHSFLHTQPHVGLALALTTCVFLWGLKQVDEARWCKIAALAATVVYTLVAGFVQTSLLALVAIVAITVVDAVLVSRNRRGAFDQTDAIIGAITLVVLTLLYEARFLPYMHAHAHWDNNAGYGLAPLAAVFAGLSVWFRRENRLLGQAMRTASVVVVALAVVLEFGYTVHDGLIQSPLRLLEWGILACALTALFGRSDVAAWVALGLTIATAVLFALGPHALYSPRETVLVWTLFGVAALYTILSARAKRLSWTYCAAVVLLAAMLAAVHRSTGALMPAYAVIAIIYAALLLGTALWLREHDPDDVWCTPLATIAITTSYACFAPLLVAFAVPSSPVSYKLDITGFTLVAVLFGAYANLYRRETYVVVTGVTLSALTLLLMRHLDPHAQTTKLSVDLGYAALVLLAGGWLGTGSGAARPALRFLPLGLLRAAIGVAVIAAVAALFGLDNGPGRYAIYSMIVLSVVLIGAGSALLSAPIEFVGKVVFGLTYFVYAIVRIQHPGVPVSDWYVLGVGVFTLAVALLAGQSQVTSTAGALVAGCLLTLGPPLAAIWAPHAAVAIAPVVAIACVLFVYWGLASRVWGLTAAGSASLAALIALAALGHTPRIHWAVFATLLGIVVIGSAMMLERRSRAQVTPADTLGA